MSSQQRKLRSRITVVESIYFTQPGEGPVSNDYKFNRVLDSDEQAYVRREKIGNDWKPLPTGWLEEGSLLVLHNDETTRSERKLSEREIENILSRIIHVGIVQHNGEVITFAEVRPGESFRICPTDLRRLRLSCPTHNATRFTVTIIPK